MMIATLLASVVAGASPPAVTTQQMSSLNWKTSTNKGLNNTPELGQTAKSSVGQAGERQNRNDISNALPLARIDTRIQNRVPLRLNTRIDRTYRGDDDPASRFTTAAEETKAPNRRGRR